MDNKKMPPRIILCARGESIRLQLMIAHIGGEVMFVFVEYEVAKNNEDDIFVSLELDNEQSITNSES